MEETASLFKNASLNDIVTASKTNFSVGDYNSTTACIGSSYNDFYRYYPNYGYSYIVYDKPNAFELAFKVVTKLLETKVIEKLTVKQLIETVNEVAKLI